jgi:hypothetical protein
MTEIRTEIEIDAPAERVWQVLMDFTSYPQWNPVMRVVRREAESGTRLKVHVRPWRHLGMTFCPTVVTAEPSRELRWQAKLLLSGLFAGDHSFTIEPIGKNKVRFIQHEVLTGLLVPLVMPVMEARIRRVFEDMNEALKGRAEQAPAAVRQELA